VNERDLYRKEMNGEMGESEVGAIHCSYPLSQGDVDVRI